MTKLPLILIPFTLIACSSGNESFPIYIDAPIAIVIDSGAPDRPDVSIQPDTSKDTSTDLTIADAPLEAEAEAEAEVEAGCIPIIGSWPCDGSFVAPDTGPYDAGFWNIESGLPRTYVSNNLSVVGSYTFPLSVSDSGSPAFYTADVPTVLSSEIAAGNIPWDEQGIYYVLTSAEVVVDDGLYCGWWCGIHFSEPIALDGGSNTLHYAATGDLGACGNCNAYPTGMPTANGNLSADTMVSVMAHEFAESATDPNPYSGWLLTSHSEVGDQCNWSFGQIYALNNGAPYNVKIGSRYFLIQRIWALNNQCSPGVLSFDVDAATPLTGDSGIINFAPATGMIEYFGGNVLNKPIHVYWLWTGSWTNRNAVEPIITDFVNNIGSSGWWGNVGGNNGYFSETKPDAGTEN